MMSTSTLPAKSKAGKAPEVAEGITTLPIEKIATDGGTQQRVKMNVDALRDYEDAWKDGADFPPVVIFYDGKCYWLADGFHRLQSACDAGREEINADIRRGKRRDAILFAVGANANHGLRRTNADKRNAVMMVLGHKAWAKRSDRWIASQCSVTHPFVAKVRAEVVTVTTSDEEKDNGRVGKDGKTYSTLGKLQGEGGTSGPLDDDQSGDDETDDDPADDDPMDKAADREIAISIQRVRDYVVKAARKLPAKHLDTLAGELRKVADDLPGLIEKV